MDSPLKRVLPIDHRQLTVNTVLLCGQSSRGDLVDFDQSRGMRAD